MKQQPTLPTFGELVPGEGGRLGAIMRGALIDGVRQPDYAIIVPDLPTVTMHWGKDVEVAGANSLTDGLTNTQDMLAAKCPAALHIAKLTADGHADLYLPARAEYWALRGNVPELFEKGWHWTSTQYSRSNAFVQDFEDGGSGWYTKGNEHRVRAVRRIQLYHFNA
jgi:hypothetical protein